MVVGQTTASLTSCDHLPLWLLVWPGRANGALLGKQRSRQLFVVFVFVIYLYRKTNPCAVQNRRLIVVESVSISSRLFSSSRMLSSGHDAKISRVLFPEDLKSG